MFLSSSHLPHLLSPAQYCSAEQHALERERLFASAWHCLGTLADIPRDGDFRTTTLAEDQAILPSVQRGMATPRQPASGLISKREERVFHFQRYVQQACSL